MLRDFLSEFKDGLFDSVHGFLVLHKLDNPPQNQTATTQPRASSAEPNPKPTILEKRRMQQKKHDKKSTPSTVPIQIKVPARRRLCEIVGINMIIIFMIYVLSCLIDLAVTDKDSYLYAFFSYFRVVLVLPIFIVIRVISTLWFADIANAASRYKGATSRSSSSIDISRAISDILHSIVVEGIFLLQALAFDWIPVPFIGHLLYLVYMSLLHSLYSFEYMWMSRGKQMNSRLSHVERHWPYHVGFGSILTILTTYLSENFFFNSCIFGALFPFFIISSFLANISDSQDSQIGHLAFFHYAQLLTNKLSLTFYRFFSPEVKNK